jgi:hypothetical protein
LAALDPQRTWDELHALAAPTQQPVLISYEEPPFTATTFCRRRLVAACSRSWLRIVGSRIIAAKSRLALCI